ncbi:MAG: phosphoglycolate phosphatase [Nitrosopumilus sp. H8]|nr:MAG: phosphoglycolate phosphatase [Nitrosopumilus sp. H13]RNJ78300.1 MAG: phosphoglycolate phosphatase [Nitrosopumilus sp. H8]
MKRLVFAVDIDGTITENGGGRIHLDALGALRRLVLMGHDVIFVTGRSSVEGFLLAVFGGMTPVSVGENGGCITLGNSEHVLLGDMAPCMAALETLRDRVKGVCEKPVFPRMTEVVLERTFDISEARDVLSGTGVSLSDSGYACHLNSSGVDKGSGFSELMQRRSISAGDVIAIGDSATDVPLFRVAGTSIALGNASEQVRSEATIAVSAGAGEGVLEALDKLAPRFPEM